MYYFDFFERKVFNNDEFYDIIVLLIEKKKS